MPDVGSCLFCRLVELDLIEESALKRLIHVLLQIRGGNHDTIELFHLLQDDVLQRVLHFIHRILCPILTLADDGISLVK